MKQDYKERAKFLQYATEDYLNMIGEAFCDYVALVKVDHNLSEFNRLDYIDFYVIHGDNQNDAMHNFNFDESHDNEIDLEVNSFIVLEATM